MEIALIVLTAWAAISLFLIAELLNQYLHQKSLARIYKDSQRKAMDGWERAVEDLKNWRKSQ